MLFKHEVEPKEFLEDWVLVVYVVVLLVVSRVLAQVPRLENDDQHRQSETDN